MDFVKSSSYYLYGKSNEIKTSYEASIPVKGKNIIIADDLVDLTNNEDELTSRTIKVTNLADELTTRVVEVKNHANDVTKHVVEVKNRANELRKLTISALDVKI